jgi:uncharacterized ferredoxin-like protein
MQERSGEAPAVARLWRGLFRPKVTQALGIPRSVIGQNPFFDRQA